MSHPLFGEIEKSIDAHESAAAVKSRLDMAKGEYDALERKLEQLELENAELKEKVQVLEDQIAMSQPSRIEEIKERILILLAGSPRTTSDQIAKKLQIEAQLSDFHIKELEAAKLVAKHHALISPAQWSLGQDGRRYLESNGLLP